MSEPLVLVSYLPDEGHYQSQLYKTVSVLCDTDTAYWRGIADHWEQPLSIVNIEHDIEWTDAQISELLDCKYDACSFVYKCHWATTQQPNGSYAATIDGRFIAPGDEWADWSAIGFIKIAPAARIAPLREVVWNRVEDAIDEAVQKPWHMHWVSDSDGSLGGVPHHHW